MPRPPRVEFPGALYHVTSRGNDRRRIFWDDTDRRTFLRHLTDVAMRDGFAVFAYCLMGNHYHLVVETPRPNLACGMQHLNSAFARWFNERHGRVGHLFQGRYHAVLVEAEPQLLELVRYVVLNPVRAGLCDRPEEWRWSSHRPTAGLEAKPRFLACETLLERLGVDGPAARSRYRSFVDDGLGRRSLPAVAAGAVPSAVYP
jgi:REP element-mobilizing transposase RayT